MDNTTKRTYRKIIAYVLLTFALSSIFYYLLISAGTMQAAGGAYVLGLMWCPGIAAIITQFIFRDSLRDLGWRLGKGRYLAWSFLIPLLYSLAVYLFVWLTGLGGFSIQKLAVLAYGEQASQLEAPPFSFLLIFLLAAMTLGMLGSVLSATGEEIGWRGLLVPELSKVTSFSRVSLISGGVWAVWHAPLILFSDYNLGAPVWYSLLCFTVMVVGISFIYAWMRLKSGSLWTAVLLHASHNLFIQSILTPLTTDTGPTVYVIDEFGIGLALVAVFLAMVFWYKRGELPKVKV